MSELALAEYVRRLTERLTELELRVDLLAKALSGVTSGDLDRPTATPPAWPFGNDEGTL